jgi:NAD(P)H-nitrite reductase large subunit
VITNLRTILLAVALALGIGHANAATREKLCVSMASATNPQTGFVAQAGNGFQGGSLAKFVCETPAAAVTPAWAMAQHKHTGTTLHALAAEGWRVVAMTTADGHLVIAIEK